MKLAWLTDIHLNFLDGSARRRFAAGVRAMDAEGVVITGDIGEAGDVFDLLGEFSAGVRVPTWFVLGNHDFYRGSIAAVRADAEAITATHPSLAWLPASGPVRLSDDTVLVGHDGWGDARLGDFEGSRVQLNDFFVIEELRRAGADLRSQLAELGDEAAGHLASAVEAALEVAPHVVVATHVPPFREACWHEGRISADDWLPFFTCGAVGEVLRAAMQEAPSARMTVLCGHTHGGGDVDILPNLRVVTGPSRYGEPQVQQIFEF